MNGFSALVLAIVGAGGNVVPPVETDPPVIAQMEELGTVYLTRFQAKTKVKKARGDVADILAVKTKPNAIIGVDFRPMSGTDPQKVTAVVKELSTLPNLQTVLLLGQDVTDDAIDALPAKLLNVRLFNTKVTDKGIAKLGRLKSLVSLSYTGTLLTDEGMKALSKMTRLQTLSITDAKGVTDKGIMPLANLGQLYQLTIENTAATQAAVDRLRMLLPQRFDPEFRSI